MRTSSLSVIVLFTSALCYKADGVNAHHIVSEEKPYTWGFISHESLDARLCTSRDLSWLQSFQKNGLFF